MENCFYRIFGIFLHFCIFCEIKIKSLLIEIFNIMVKVLSAIWDGRTEFLYYLWYENWNKPVQIAALFKYLKKHSKYSERKFLLYEYLWV